MVDRYTMSFHFLIVPHAMTARGSAINQKKFGFVVR